MRRRRAVLALLPACWAGACSLLPEHPYVEVRRFPLSPSHPAPRAPRTGAPVVLLRPLRAGPGLAIRGLRRLRADGTLFIEPYAEWAAPPAEAAEAALRHWLAASGLFAAIAHPGTRLPAPLVLEGELSALHALPDGGAEAQLTLLLIEEAGLAQARLLAQIAARGRAGPEAGGAGPDGAAAAMQAALAAALAEAEAALAAALGTRRR
ncbi:MAG: ABC-type transport auxiliary lipoprotein family protein [Rhodovarius sp.]|nr:ABC-type transport auxiliary lipoprotein family protein [Rhodovarius sp.]